MLLAELIRTGDSAIDVGRRSVRKRRVRAASTGDPSATLMDAMAQQGFEPEARTRRGHLEVVLRVCPFATAALTDPDTVCSLHLGIAQGIADTTGGRIVIDELIRHDPRRANCRLRIHLEPD